MRKGGRAKPQVLIESFRRWRRITTPTRRRFKCAAAQQPGISLLRPAGSPELIDRRFMPRLCRPARGSAATWEWTAGRPANARKTASIAACCIRQRPRRAPLRSPLTAADQPCTNISPGNAPGPVDGGRSTIRARREPPTNDPIQRQSIRPVRAIPLRLDGPACAAWRDAEERRGLRRHDRSAGTGVPNWWR